MAGALRLTNTTFYSNTARGGPRGGAFGGAVFNLNGPAVIINSTLAGNTVLNATGAISAPAGGGIYSLGDGGLDSTSAGGDDLAYSADLTLRNTIVANSGGITDCVVSIYQGGFSSANGANNLVEKNEGCAGITVTDNPNLDSLQDNGGDTWTMGLLSGSPALDAGDDATCVATDQRGIIRPIDGDGNGAAACDIGAYELNPVCFATPDNGTTVYRSENGHAVQEAVDAAAGGGVVKVAGYCAGVEMRDSLTQTTYISKNLTIRGGYTTADWTTAYPAIQPTLDAQSGGRVLVISGTVEVLLENLRVTNGRTTGNSEDGGGIRAVGATVAISNSRVFSNSVTGAGSRGGGLYTDQGLTLTNTQFLSNTATNHGGGLFALSTLTLTNTDFISNTATNDGGGAYVLGAATLNGGSFERNIAASGGGLLAGGGTLTLANTEFLGNTAQNSGGGLLATWTMTLTNTQFLSNTAQNNGGGMYYSSISISGGRLVNNYFENNGAGHGAGLHLNGVVDIRTSAIVSNTAVISGGGVYIAGGAAQVMTTTIGANSASTAGGGVYNLGTVVLTNTTVSTNTASNGGGLWNSGAMTLTRSSMVISNTTTGNGGGAYNQTGGALRLDGGRVQDNRAANGGGLYNKAALTLNGHLVYTNTTTTDGGGVYNDTSGVMTMAGGDIRDNLAQSGDGGGLLNRGTVNLQDNADVEDNRAGSEGGGVYNDSGGVIDATSGRDSDLRRNTSTNDGGGLYNRGTVTWDGANDMHDNVSTSGNGGAIHNSGALILTHSSVRDNSANNGGGVYNTTGTAVFSNTTLSSNANDGLYNASGTAALSYTTVASNTGGSGIHVEGGAVYLLATIIAYHGGSDCTNNATLTSNDYNLASDNTCNLSETNDITATDPLLGPIYGAVHDIYRGTHPLLPGSDAIDHIPNGSASCNTIGTDQRFVARPIPSGGNCDIGAYEFRTDLRIKKYVSDYGQSLAKELTVPQNQLFITYTLRVTNTYTSDPITDTFVTDKLPLSVTLIASSTTHGVYTPTTGVWDLQNGIGNELDPQAVAILTLTLHITDNTPVGAIVNNTGVISESQPPDDDLSDNTDTVTVTIGPPEFDLQIKKTSAVSQIFAGRPLTYTLTLTNPGPGSVNAVVTDTFTPTLAATAIVSQVSATNGGSCSGNGPLVCTFVDLTGTATISLSLDISSTFEGVLTNTAYITFNNVTAVDLDGDNNSSSTITTTVITPPDLNLVKSASTLTPVVGSRFTYTIVISNDGTTNATGGLVSDTVPAGLSFGPASLDPPGGTPGTPPTLASNLTITGHERITLTVPVTLAYGLTPGLLITNTAAVTSAEVNTPVTGTVVITVRTPLLEVSKTSTNTNGNTLLPDETITYTIVVTNSGNMNANKVVISDFTGVATNFVDNSVTVEPDQGQKATTAADLPRLAWNLTITPNQPLTVTFAITVSTGVADGQDIANTVSVTSTEIITPVTDTVTDTVGYPILGLDKTAQDAGGGYFAPGETITYTIVVSNSNLTAPATDVVISDTVPASTTYIVGSISGGDVRDDSNPPVLSWTVNSLAANNPVTLTFAVTISTAATDGLKIVNTADVTGSNVITPAADTVTSTVQFVPPLTVTISGPTEGAVATGHIFMATVLPPTTTIPLTYTWQATDQAPTVNGNQSSLFNTILYSWPTTGVKVITVTVANGAGAVSNTHTITISYMADLGLSKMVNNVTPQEGERITYTITLASSGPNKATNVVVSDTLPLNVTFAASTTNKGVYNPATGLWTVGNLAQGEQVTATLAVTINPGTLGQTITNTATLSDSTPADTTPDNNSASAVVTIGGGGSGDIYLPLIFQSPAPDLIVSYVAASSNAITVTIVNTGTAAVVDAFWVDAYINPNPAPPGLNQLGDLWWGLDATNGGLPVEPGEVVTLTLDSPFFAGGDPFPIAPGSDIYAQVDAVGTYSYGEVNERQENNNVKGPEPSVAGLGAPPFGNSGGAAFNAEGLPPRK